MSFVDWLSSPGFGGAAAVVAAAGAFIGTRVGVATQRRNARADRWWDRTEWAVDMAISDDERAVTAGLEAMDVLVRLPSIDGPDEDELEFLGRVADTFLVDAEAASLGAQNVPGGSQEED